MAIQGFLNKRIILILVVVIVLVAATTCRGFIRGPFSGRVIDAETREPIEGAVVLVVWQKVIYGSPGGPSQYFLDARETLTDKNGDFHIGAYREVVVLTPIESIRDEDMRILIFKPGYVVFPGSMYFQKMPKSPYSVGTDTLIKLFTEERKNIRSDEEFFYDEAPFLEDKEAFKELLKKDVAVVELPRLKTREERLRNIPGSSDPFRNHYDKKKNFMKLLNIERKKLGLAPEGKPSK